MGVFDNMLKSGESIFLNELALDFSFQPKLLLHREKEQFAIANAIRPLFANRNGKNIMLYGKPGIGKTLAVKHVFRELEEEHEEVLPVYVNCWQHNSTFKIAIALCEAVDYKFYQNKKTHEIFKDLQDKFNKTNVAFCFDEVDKVEDFDFLYTLLENVFRKTVIMISN
jgi:cell division control protein 6